MKVAAAFSDEETTKLLKLWGAEWRHVPSFKRPVPIAQAALARRLRNIEREWKAAHPDGVTVCFDLLPNVGDIVVGPAPAHLWWSAQQSAGINPWRRPWMRLWHGLVEKKIIQGKQRIIVFSEQAKTGYEALGMPSSRIQRVFLLVDLSFFHPPKEEHPKDEVLIIGSSPTVKGVDLALKAWESVCQFFPGLRLRIVCKPKSRAARLASGKARVIISQPVDDPRVYYYRAKLVLAPSVFETWCNVVAEALACGVPVITSQYVAASELVQEPWLGLVIRRTPSVRDSARRLAEAMMKFLRNEEMLRLSMQYRRWEHVRSIQAKTQDLLGWARSL
ncbi:MAG: glycosyltransferase [Zetaproteobacteria bacterium]|nr:MAG: glycosyltransferase [Zetaproteobacteria bacterium]